MPSFSEKKQLRFVITLGTGKFGSSNNDQIVLQGFRATVDVDKAGGMMMGTLRARIYGVRQQDMNSVTTLQWKPAKLIPNTVEVFALDGAAETLVFAGNIVNAWADYQSMPDVFLHIQAQSGFYNQLLPVKPRSFKGRIDVASVMAQIARDLGYTFENNGVTTQLVDIYLPNTGLEQAKDLCRAAGCDLYLDDKILAITPPNQPRSKAEQIPAVDNTEKISALLEEWKKKHAEFEVLFKQGEAAEAQGNQGLAMEYYKKAKVANTEAGVILDRAKALKAQERPAYRAGVPIISAQSGLVGYPTFDGVGVNFQTLFNPSIQFGGLMQIETDVQQAAGEWIVTSVAHRLEVEKPGGVWYSRVRGNANGIAVIGR